MFTELRWANSNGGKTPYLRTMLNFRLSETKIVSVRVRNARGEKVKPRWSTPHQENHHRSQFH